MKSLLLLLIISVLLYICYNFSYTYFYKNKVKKEIKYLLLPNSVDLFYNQKSLNLLFKDMFNQNFDLNTKTFE